MGASRKSRVVPGSALTSARAEPLSALSKLDFPAFGAPTTATRRPVRRAASCRAVRAYPESSDSILTNVCKGPAGSSVGRASSGKSICASSVASAARRRSLHAATCRPNSPASWRRAEASARSELAWIKSAIASAWVRSILPARKARRVNSPGSAERQPRARQSSTSRRTRRGLP